MGKREGFYQKEEGTMNNGDAARIKHERCATHRLNGRDEQLLVAVLGNEGRQEQRRHQSNGAKRGSGHTRRRGQNIYQQTYDKTTANIDDARRAQRHFQEEIDVGQRRGISQQVDMVEEGGLQKDKNQDPKD